MDYLYPPFWILLIILIILGCISIGFHKLSFADIQIIIMTTALGFASDMLLCKQFGQYYFVAKNYRGWYSFWACVGMNPALALIYIKLLPKKRIRLIFYIGLWSLALTLLELFIALPYGIVHYPRWRILPWSPILYIVVFIWEYIYYKWLKKNLNY
ncbi:hypothetical protein [Sporosalibacterium faouarense]|uniref:hypothetical protein n=1 Tax=Sporosalibacterium faouarense TaxID=516123 RepID=UPI00192CCE5E|nr:hypothetical protein [Sporosalibacterium faouarense]